MATYCIGDVHGCFDELIQLLKIVDYNCRYDRLWFVGDLVNRGTKSLEVLRFIRNQNNVKTVLGNHDLTLINLYDNNADSLDIKELKPILEAPDGKELIEWLRGQPLMYYDEQYNCILVHAGIHPKLNLVNALQYAKEIESILRDRRCCIKFLKHFNDKNLIKWSDNLKGLDKYRFIVNTFTKMRFCDLKGNLEFDHTGKINTAPRKYFPWFSIPERKTKNIKIIFGHWAALEGETNEPNVITLDTGCVWGKNLTTLRIDDGIKFTFPRIRI
jgi:bis(5'-nucleosyl)-tetraphosphatase (symmetrical)